MLTDGPIFITQPFQRLGFARTPGPNELIPENLVKIVWGDVDPGETDPVKITNSFSDSFLKRQLTLSSIYMESGRDQEFVDTVNESLNYLPYYEAIYANSGPYITMLRVALYYNICIYSFERGIEDHARRVLATAIETFDSVEEPSGAEANQYYSFLGAALEGLARKAGVPFRWDEARSAPDTSNAEVPFIITQFCAKLGSQEIKHVHTKWGSNRAFDSLLDAVDLKRSGQYGASLQTYVDEVYEGGYVSFDTIRGMFKTTVAATYVVSALQLLLAARRNQESRPDFERVAWNGRPYRPYQLDFQDLSESMRSQTEALKFMQSVSGNSQFELLRPIQTAMDEWNSPLARSLRQELQAPAT